MVRKRWRGVILLLTLSRKKKMKSYPSKRTIVKIAGYVKGGKKLVTSLEAVWATLKKYS